ALIDSNKILVIAGPDQQTIMLHNTSTSPFVMEVLASNHTEADARVFLHIYDILADNDGPRYNGIILQATDTDIIILSIACVSLFNQQSNQILY
ncbi:unnamed protein product, partial [Didymodactylos carnosus]